MSQIHLDSSEKTRKADIAIAAAGVPELVDGSMLSDGAVVIDVGTDRVDADTSDESELVGDVEFQGAKEKASVITPVPGGVGPVTISMLLYNTVKAVSLQEDVAVELPQLTFERRTERRRNRSNGSCRYDIRISRKH